MGKKRDKKNANNTGLDTSSFTSPQARDKQTRRRSGIPIDPHDLSVVAMKSSLQTRAIESLFAIDDAMRANYDALKATVASSIRPVIVVQSDLQGGTYTLLEHGRRTTVQPVPPIFQMVKSVSHAPLGIYSIIAPYLGSGPTTAWQSSINNFRSILVNANSLLSDSPLPSDALKACETIIKHSVQFIDHIVAKEIAKIDDFKSYTGPLETPIAINLEIAAKAQVTSVRELLQRWKLRLGKRWTELYAIILVIWTTEIDNQHELILKTEMDPERVADHLIVLGTASLRENTIETAMDNLAQIVQDNIAAALIFSNPDALDTLLGTNLKGPEDLLSWSVKGVLKSCPHVHKYAVDSKE